MSVDTRPRRPLLALSEVLLALAWMLGGLITAVLALLLTQPFATPECTSYDRWGQRVGQVGALVTMSLFAVVWIASVLCLRRSPQTAITRLVLAIALPIAIVLAFVAGGVGTAAAIEAIAPNAGQASCW